jgi:hypothetical protein
MDNREIQEETIMRLANLAIPFSLAALIAVGASPARAAGITEIFDVAPGGTVTLSAEGAAIDVTGGNRSEAAIHIRRGDDHADSIEDDYLIEFYMENNHILGSIKRRNRPGRWFSRPLSIEINLPREFNIDLESSGGHIHVNDLTGTMATRTSGGSLRFDTVDGMVKGNTSGGSIYLESTSESAELGTSGGTITVGTVDGAVTARTSGGAISIERAGGTVDARTSGGSIEATFDRQPDADSRLTTSGGSIDIRVNPDLALTVEARTSGNRVVNELPLAPVADTSDARLEGDLNGGGPLLYARTSGGSITLREL